MRIAWPGVADKSAPIDLCLRIRRLIAERAHEARVPQRDDEQGDIDLFADEDWQVPDFSERTRRLFSLV